MYGPIFTNFFLKSHVYSFMARMDYPSEGHYTSVFHPAFSLDGKPRSSECGRDQCAKISKAVDAAWSAREHSIQSRLDISH